MRVLLVSAEFPPYGSGIGNVVLALRNHMQRKGIGAHVLSRRGADINIADTISDLPGLAGLIAFWQKAANHIAKIAPIYDLVWMHSPLLASIRKLYFASRIMVTFHTTYHGFYESYKTHAVNHLLPYYYLSEKAESFFLKKLQHLNNAIITAVSPSVAEEVCRNGLSVYPQIVPNGLDANSRNVYDKCRARAYLRKRYSLKVSRDAKVLLYVGRITEAKQPFLLVDLFRRIGCLRSDIQLVIAGDGNLLRKLREKTTHQENVRLLGRIPHKIIPILLNAADAFISVSCYEGLPLSVLEAASFHVPLILSDIPAHRWIIDSKVGYGKLISSRNPNPEEILGFMSQTSQVKASHARLDTYLYSWDNIVNQYLRLM